MNSLRLPHFSTLGLCFKRNRIEIVTIHDFTCLLTFKLISILISQCLTKSRLIMYDQKIATEHFSPERPGVIHAWCHASHGLRWTNGDKSFILLFLIARFRASGFTLIAIDVLATHWHILLLAEGERIDAKTLRMEWDDKALITKLPKKDSHWRIDYLCESSNNLSEIMHSLMGSLVIRLNQRHEADGRGERFGTWFSGGFRSRLLGEADSELARRDPASALRVAISYVENNGVDAGLAETPADDPFSGIGHAKETGKPIFREEKLERVAIMLAGVDRIADLKRQWAETEHTPRLCEFVQRKLEEICVGRSLRHAVRKHCLEQNLDPQGDEADAILRGLQKAFLKAHAIGSEAEVRRAIAALDERHSRLKKRLYRLPIAGFTMLGSPPAAARAERRPIEA